MLRRLRINLRMIRYYSAERPRTKWSHLHDAALILALVLAPLAAWLANYTIVRFSSAFSISGMVGAMPDQSLRASVTTGSNASRLPIEATPIGTFNLSSLHWHVGWPLTMSVYDHPAQLDLDLRTEPKARADVKLAADDPLRTAIAEAIGESEDYDALDAWAQSKVIVRPNWLAWAASIGMWWVIIAVTFSLFVLILRFGSFMVKRRRLARAYARRMEGKCYSCGYDLTGLEFNERCPECGELVW